MGACYIRKLKNFNFLGASDARRVNSQHLYTLAKVLRVFYNVLCVLSVLRVFYQYCDCFISVASVLTDCFNFLLLVFIIYQTSILCTPFGMNQHTNLLAAGIRLLTYKHRVCGVLCTEICGHD